MTEDAGDQIGPSHPEQSTTEMRHGLGKVGLGDLTSPDSRSLEALHATLSDLDASIPGMVEAFNPNHGRRYERPKRYDAANSEAAIGELCERFPADADKLFTATTALFSRLIIEDVYDPTDVGKIDEFVSGYPHNVLLGLGDAATADNLAAILDFSTRLVEDRERQLGDDEFKQLPSTQGSVAELTGGDAPQIVAKYGLGQLDQIEEIAVTEGVTNAQRYTKFLMTYPDGLPEAPFDPANLIDTPVPDSPFTTSGNKQWRNESWLGVELREPEWGDLTAMVALSDQWNGEYGLTISDSVQTTLGFIRGGKAWIKNRHQLGEGKKVFFHSHPSHGTKDGLLAPLVSDGDMTATQMTDYGGGYLNIVCRDGITLQIGSEPITEHDKPGWRVESGEFKDTVIATSANPDETTNAIMQNLRDAGKPYSYSITTPGTMSRKVIFVHIPWSQLQYTKTSLKDVCFGDGLRTLLPPELQTADDGPVNLHGAIKAAKRLN